MTTIEQLRKELNELRERIVILENRTVGMVSNPQPHWIKPADPYSPPYTITCQTDK